jgi:hypothetical protein
MTTGASLHRITSSRKSSKVASSGISRWTANLRPVKGIDPFEIEPLVVAMLDEAVGQPAAAAFDRQTRRIAGLIAFQTLMTASIVRRSSGLHGPQLRQPISRQCSTPVDFVVRIDRAIE